MLPFKNPSSLKLFRSYNKNNIRIVFLSTKIQLTPEEINKEIEKIEKYRKFVSKTGIEIIASYFCNIVQTNINYCNVCIFS